MTTTKDRTTRLVVIAFLIALEIILTRFCSINTPIVRIGFGFLPIAMIGILYGPLWAGTAYALGDLLGMMIFPSGPFFPGFTATAFLTGLVYGFVLHGKPITWKRALISACIVCGILNLCLDTTWLYIMMGQAVIGLIPTRLLKVIIMIPTQTIIIPLAWNKILSHLPIVQINHN